MRKILFSAAAVLLLSLTQANDSIKLEQGQKKCKTATDCGNKPCNRGICANNTLLDLLKKEMAVSEEE